MIIKVENKQLFILLDELKTRLVKLYGKRLFSLILFGSHARGEATPDSDIDVMAVLSDPVDVFDEISRMSDVRWYFLMEYDELVSIIPTSESDYLSCPRSFLRVVRREGIKI